MNFFCSMKYCTRCGVAFKPRADATLCKPHAEEQWKEDRRRGEILEWFHYNKTAIQERMGKDAPYWLHISKGAD